MLRIPPALATKSGTWRIPRSARSSSTPRPASWLLAAPHTARHASRATVLRVEHAAEGAGREHVAVLLEERVDVDRLAAGACRDGLGPGGQPVGDDESGARLGKQVGEMRTDLADPLDRDR